MKLVLLVLVIVSVAVIGVMLKRGQNQTPVQKDGGYITAMTQGLSRAREINQQSYTVDLNGQGFTALPTEFFEGKENVRVLDVSQNSLTGALPAEIRKIEQLRTLDASENSLTGIPAEIGQLKYLEIIDFSNNQINTFPQEIANLKGTLKTLDVRGNPFSQESIAELKKMLPDTEVIF